MWTLRGDRVHGPRRGDGFTVNIVKTENGIFLVSSATYKKIDFFIWIYCEHWPAATGFAVNTEENQVLQIQFCKISECKRKPSQPRLIKYLNKNISLNCNSVIKTILAKTIYPVIKTILACTISFGSNLRHFWHYTLLEKLWRIWLYMTDEANARLYHETFCQQ